MILSEYMLSIGHERSTETALCSDVWGTPKLALPQALQERCFACQTLILSMLELTLYTLTQTDAHTHTNMPQALQEFFACQTLMLHMQSMIELTLYIYIYIHTHTHIDTHTHACTTSTQ